MFSEYTYIHSTYTHIAHYYNLQYVENAGKRQRNSELQILAKTSLKVLLPLEKK